MESVAPDAAEVEEMIALHGPNLFYDSVAKRRLCCEIRKVRPLERKLAAFEPGSPDCGGGSTPLASRWPKWRRVDGRVKISPLADWTRNKWKPTRASTTCRAIRCTRAGTPASAARPCTRATEEGEDERAGRWWWEQDADKECGMHFSPDGKAERTVDVLLREVLETARA